MKEIKEVKQIKTIYVNKTENYIIGEEKININDSVITNLKSLYKFGIKEYGKCVSKMYIDDNKGKPKHIGYVFVKKDKYEDTQEEYLKEIWVSIEHYKETTIREYKEVA